MWPTNAMEARVLSSRLIFEDPLEARVVSEV
jgi:hypothetical protein